jgi:membrane associated rhomboid family serine protease
MRELDITVMPDQNGSTEVKVSRGPPNHPTGLIALGIIVAINFTVYIDMATIYNTLDFSAKQVYRYGADTFGADWRQMLIPATYMHFGISHIGMNMLALISFGRIAAKRMGFLKFLIFYTLCGAIASAVSLTTHSARVVGAGASGAISGVFGSLLIVRLLGDKSCDFNGLIGVLVYNVLFAILSPVIDWEAHLGGFIAGLALGLIFVPGKVFYSLVALALAVVVIGAMH